MALAILLLIVYRVSQTIYRHYQLSLRPLVIAAGSKSAAYYKLSARYAQFLVAKGVRVKVCETSGSVEILRMLSGLKREAELSCQSWEPGGPAVPPSGREVVEASAGFVQGGLSHYLATQQAEAKGPQPAEVVSLGRVIVEPLWIYHRCVPAGTARPPLTTFKDLLNQARGGRPIVIGRPGSGTEDLMNRLIGAHGGFLVERRNLIEAGSPGPDGQPAASDETLSRAMQDPKVLAFATVGAVGLPSTTMFTINRGYLAKELCLMDFAGSDGLVQQLPFLSLGVVRRGAFSLSGAADMPERDLTLLTTKAAFVVKDALDPALKTLLAEAILNEKNESKMENFFFPLPAKSLEEDDLEYRKAEEAQQVYRSERGFFQRNLPFFWIATYLDTFILYVVALPFLGLVWPLFRLLPATQEYLARRRLNNMHWELSQLEANIRVADSLARLDDYQAELDKEAAFIRAVPLAEADRFSLRRHLELVSNALTARQKALTPPASASAPPA